MAIVLVVVATVAAACSQDPEDARPSDPCRDFIDRAGAAAEISEQVELLDSALVVCNSVEAFAVNAQRHPTLFGVDVATYLSTRCATVDDDGIQGSRVCTSDAVTTTTMAPVAPPEVVYLGTTLDGREVEIRPRAGRPFDDDGVPAIISAMADIAIAEGCDGLEAEFERWNNRIEDPLIGDEASVFAQHAQNVLAFIDCI